MKVFIDDVLVFGSSKEEHDARLNAVLNRLKDNGLTINETQCEFGQPTVKFMGYQLSANAILPTNEKVSAIQNFRRPQSASEMRSFLGLVNYVGKFIPNLSALTAPLREMIVKGVKFHWSRESKRSFNEVKQAMSNPNHLAFYNLHYKTVLITDASDNGLGAVSMQTSNSKSRPVSQQEPLKN